MSLATSPCAIVGGGLVGFAAYATLRHAGLRPEEIVVFCTDDDPAAAWLRRAASIRQERMRSESDGHCGAASFPGLAVEDALRRKSPLPLLASACDRYRPTVARFLAHVARLRERTGWDWSLSRHRVRRVRAVQGGFELDGSGPFRHVLLAPGHPGLNVPAELEHDPRAVHAYEPHEYAGTVAIVGAGMAAATEWLNALAAGASVVSVRRREPERRPLNVPRPLFTRRGLAAYHRTTADMRTEFLHRLLAPSYPPGRGWDEPLARATRDGRFRISDHVDGADQIICATGFARGFARDPLLAGTVAEHGLATAETWIMLDPDSTVPGLTDTRRTLSLAGAPAQWAFPAADTLVGAKYAARGFLRRIERCRSH
jgi:cation diffusion facilitator CzcD-associated flavoprotein CzcO